MFMATYLLNDLFINAQTIKATISNARWIYHLIRIIDYAIFASATDNE